MGLGVEYSDSFYLAKLVLSVHKLMTLITNIEAGIPGWMQEEFFMLDAKNATALRMLQPT